MGILGHVGAGWAKRLVAGARAAVPPAPNLTEPNRRVQAFYHHLMKPYKHYIPVWKVGSGPEDILDAVDWARGNDDAAHKMALEAQQLAGRYLSREARECFWLKLFEGYAETMTYNPISFRNITEGEDGNLVGTWRFIKPARQFLEEDVTKYFPGLLKELIWEP